MLAKSVQSEIFRSSFSSWNTLCQEARNFASSVGREDLINISHSSDNSQGVIVVWYWGQAKPGQ